MAVGIPEIKAHSAAGPGEAALDRNPLCFESFSPCGQTLRRDFETNMRLAFGSMRRNESEWKSCSLRIAALEKENQNLLSVYREGTEPFVRLHHRISKKARIKLT